MRATMRGSTFRLKMFSKEGTPYLKIVGKKKNSRPFFILHDSRRIPGPWDFLYGSNSIFIQISFLSLNSVFLSSQS